MDLLDIDRLTAQERAPDKRRRDPLRLALAPAHEARGLSGLDGVHLMHDALPELDLEDVSLAARLFGQAARTPFYVTGLATGRADAATLNRRLARACTRRGWAMGVGLQRRPLSGPTELTDAADAWQRLRDAAPALDLVINLGLGQVAATPLALLRRVLQSTQAQALAVYLNPLQECLQPGGTPQFRGGLAALREACVDLGLPVVLKESGCGFSQRTLTKLQGMALGALDVCGLGGTHWGRIEGARAEEGSLPAQAAATFADWGESTVDSVRAAGQALPDVELWASGGVRSGLDAAKLIALGAERVGYAKPALQAALWGDAALDDWMSRQEQELRIALFCSGAASPAELRRLHGAIVA